MRWINEVVYFARHIENLNGISGQVRLNEN